MTDIDRQDLAALVEYLQREALPYNERGRRCARALSALEQAVAEDGPLWITEGEVASLDIMRGMKSEADVRAEQQLAADDLTQAASAAAPALDDDIPF